MATGLPHAESAVLDIRKLEDYCLNPSHPNPSHPRGRHKARVFRQVLDVGPSDAPWLRDTLLQAARTREAAQVGTDVWGSQWRIDVTITRQERTAVVRTIWIIRTGENFPRFVSCWVLR